MFKNEEGNGMFFLPIKKFPSLFIVAIKGSEFMTLLMSFVLPKFNSFATLELANCPLTSADLSALFSGLYQTNTLKALKLINTKLGTQGAKQLAATLEQNRSLKVVIVNDETILDEGIRALESVLENHITVEEYNITTDTDS